MSDVEGVTTRRGKKRAREVPSDDESVEEIEINHVDEDEPIHEHAVTKKKPKKKKRKTSTRQRSSEMSSVHNPIAKYIRDRLNGIVKVFHSCPVGSWKPNGKSKQVCYQSGWPDIFIPKLVKSTYSKYGFFSGLAIECKNGYKGLQKTEREHLQRQKNILTYLEDENYLSFIVLSAERGIQLVLAYLDPNKHHLLFEEFAEKEYVSSEESENDNNIEIVEQQEDIEEEPTTIEE